MTEANPTRAVLGIDAAWTLKHPSGVALVSEFSSGWRLTSVTPSYLAFHALANAEKPSLQVSGRAPDARVLLEDARSLCGVEVVLVAIDMPLSYTPITSRRACDNEVSRAYGSRHCSTHTPSSERPGRISDDLRTEFDSAGYPLQTQNISPPGLIEVYPHPALVELAKDAQRLPYKSAKVRKYWPDLTPPERRQRLLQEWDRIIDLLDAKISGVTATLKGAHHSLRSGELKSVEDMLDAVVCAWVAIETLEGRASPYGDQDSSIWIPNPR